MTTFLALLRGRCIDEAQIVAVSVDPDLVKRVATSVLANLPETGDPVQDSLIEGRKRALHHVAQSSNGVREYQGQKPVMESPRDSKCSHPTDTVLKGGDYSLDTNKGS